MGNWSKQVSKVVFLLSKDFANMQGKLNEWDLVVELGWPGHLRPEIWKSQGHSLPPRFSLWEGGSSQ